VSAGGGTTNQQGDLFVISVVGGGYGFTFTLNGKTYRDLPQPSLELRLLPGTYTIDGMNGAGLANNTPVAIISQEGSLVPGSFRVLAGTPVPGSASPCGVVFANYTQAATPFKVQFQVQRGASGSCHL
jgi:hypothetical protein